MGPYLGSYLKSSGRRGVESTSTTTLHKLVKPYECRILASITTVTQKKKKSKKIVINIIINTKICYGYDSLL